MISKTLVTIDGSAHSMKAVDTGAGEGAKVVLLHVIKQDLVPEAIKESSRAEYLPEIDADTFESGVCRDRDGVARHGRYRGPAMPRAVLNDK